MLSGIDTAAKKEFDATAKKESKIATAAEAEAATTTSQAATTTTAQAATTTAQAATTTAQAATPPRAKPHVQSLVLPPFALEILTLNRINDLESLKMEEQVKGQIVLSAQKKYGPDRTETLEVSTGPIPPCILITHDEVASTLGPIFAGMFGWAVEDKLEEEHKDDVQSLVSSFSRAEVN